MVISSQLIWNRHHTSCINHVALVCWHELDFLLYIMVVLWKKEQKMLLNVLAGLDWWHSYQFHTWMMYNMVDRRVLCVWLMCVYELSAVWQVCVGLWFWEVVFRLIITHQRLRVPCLWQVLSRYVHTSPVDHCYHSVYVVLGSSYSELLSMCVCVCRTRLQVSCIHSQRARRSSRVSQPGDNEVLLSTWQLSDHWPVAGRHRRQFSLYIAVSTPHERCSH